MEDFVDITFEYKYKIDDYDIKIFRYDKEKKINRFCFQINTYPNEPKTMIKYFIKFSG